MEQKTTKIFITADTHLGHANMMKFNPKTRPFRDVVHMNEEIVLQWNRAVGPDDLVYHLGDVAFCQASQAVQYLRRMNGRKILIQGNHDHKLVQDQGFRDCFEAIHMYHQITHDQMKISLFHFPIKEWDQCHRGALHCFGHQHGNGGEQTNRSMDVGMDATGNVVTDLSEIVRVLLKRPLQGHH